MTSLYNSWAWQDGPAAAVSALTLPPGENRLEALRQVRERWSQRDAPAAQEWLRALPPGRPGRAGKPSVKVDQIFRAPGQCRHAQGSSRAAVNRVASTPTVQQRPMEMRPLLPDSAREPNPRPVLSPQ